jgi:hypothetical protein
MLCETVKKGVDCAFMSKKGCGFIGSSCHPVVEQCGECSKIFDYESGKYCKVYPEPKSKWLRGNCPTASHVKMEISEAQKINPLKASKRASKKK